MGRIAYVNGRYQLHRYASIHIEDRGYQFSDGVYEVIAVIDGQLVDENAHFARLARSLGELRIPMPVSQKVFRIIISEIIRRNRINHFGAIYLQITRGIASRNHAFPSRAQPVVVVIGRSLPVSYFAMKHAGVKVVSVRDERWGRADIKTISLLPNVLAKQFAVDSGAFEAWMVDENGMVTEGSASNAWIVSVSGELLTRPTDHSILAGVTRATVLRLACEHGIQFVERPFSVLEVRNAREAFLTSTTSWVKPVIQIDDALINNGIIGPLSEKLMRCYASYVKGREI